MERLKEYKRHIIFCVIYIICSLGLSFLIFKGGFEGNHKFYDDVSFDVDGNNYCSEKLSVPMGIFETSVTYSCTKESLVEISADNKVVASTVAPATPAGEYNIVTMLNGTVNSTSNYVICFYNVADSDVSVIGVDFNGNVQMNRDSFAKALLWFVVLMSGLVYILLTMTRRINREQSIVVFVLVAFVLYISTPLQADSIFSAHDLFGLCGRIEGIKDALNDGQVFPIVLPNANNGYGYLGFMYPELFLLFPALLRKADISMVTAYQIYLLLINVATAVIAYVSVFSLLKDIRVAEGTNISLADTKNYRIISLCCSIFYLLATYRLTDIYVRAAVGEAVSMTFLPLVITGLFHVYEGDRKKWLTLVLGLSGILHSHILSCAMIIPFLIIFTIPHMTHIIKDKRYKEIAYSIVTFFVINSWYLIPFVKFYRFGLNTDALLIEDISEHTVPVRQLFAININARDVDNLVLTIGMASLVVIILTGVYFIERLSTRTVTMQNHNFMINFKFISSITFVFVTYLLFSLELMPWEWINHKSAVLEGIFSMLQFPFRLLTISMACLLFMLAFCLAKTDNIRENRTIVMAAIIILSIVSSSSFIDSYVTGDIDIKEYTGGFADHTPPDYLPAGTDETIFGDLNAYIDDGSIEMIKNGTNVSINYYADSDTTASIPLLYYPCYKAYDENGNGIELYSTEVNRIGLKLPKGEHQVNVRLKLF